MDEDDKPSVKLTGNSSNAGAIMGACTKAAHRAGWSQERINALRVEMMSGDYNHLLMVAMEKFDVS